MRPITAGQKEFDMTGNLTGWHLLIILGVLLVAALIVTAVVIAIVIGARRRSASGKSSSGGSARVPVAQRLDALDELRDQGAVTAIEYDTKRRQLLDEV